MNSICITFHTVVFRPQQVSDPRKQFDLDKVLDQASASSFDVYDEVPNYLDELVDFDEKKKLTPEQKKELDDKKLVYIDSESIEYSPDKRLVSGRMLYGDYGYTSTLVDTSTGNESYKRKVSDRELVPFYFWFELPKGKKAGILALQTYGVHSFATPVVSSFKSYFSRKVPDLMVDMRSIQLGDLFVDDFLSEGKLKKIELIRYSQPADKASENKNEKIKGSFMFSPAQRNGVLPSAIIQKFKGFKKKDKSTLIKDVSELLAIDDNAFEDMNFIVEMNGKNHKLNVDNVLPSATRIDVTAEARLEDDGHPNFDLLDKWVRATISKSIRPKLV